MVEIDDSEPHYVPQKIQSYSRHTGVDNDSSLFNLEESGEKQNTSTSIVQGFSYSDVQIKTSSDNFPAASFSQISHTSRHERDDHSEQSGFARSKDTSLESIVKIEPGAENEHEFIVAGISGYQGDLGQGDTGEMGYQTLESGEQSMSQSSKWKCKPSHDIQLKVCSFFFCKIIIFSSFSVYFLVWCFYFNSTDIFQDIVEKYHFLCPATKWWRIMLYRP